MIATSGFVKDLECNKFVFGWGSTPDPAGGANNAPRPLTGLGGLLLRGMWKGGKGKSRGEGEEKGRGRERIKFTPPFTNS